MLRCTIAGMIPLMMSKKYGYLAEEIMDSRKNDIDEIVDRRLYHMIPMFPHWKAREMMLLLLPEIVEKQKKNGLWGNKDAIFDTYNILSALKYTDLFERVEIDLLKKTIGEHYDYHSLMIKKMIGILDCKDEAIIKQLINEMKNQQNENGSWEDTVIATIYYMNRLLNLGMAKDDSVINKGVLYLFDCFNVELDALHTKDPYGLKVNYIFTSRDRRAEYEAADKYFQELVPRSKCFRHIAIIQHSLCLNFLIKIEMEKDERVEHAMDSIYQIYKNYNGLCDSDVKKKYLQMQKNRKKERVKKG